MKLFKANKFLIPYLVLDVQKIFIAKLKATKIEESKQTGKKGVNIGSGKTVEVKRGATHEYEEEYFDDEDYDEDY